MANTLITDKGNVLTPNTINLINAAIAGGGVPTVITANGAVDPHTSAQYLFTKAGVAAMTLAAPTVTTDDGVTISLTGTTTDQNTVTATGLFKCGTAAVNLATWPAQAGGTITIKAYQGLWYVISNNLVVFS